MTESSNQEQTAEVRRWLETWKTCVERVLAQVSGQAMSFEISAEPLAAADSDLRYALTVAGAVRGEMSLRLPSDSAVRLAQKFLGESEPSGGPTAEHKEALEELLRQIGGQASTALGATLGGEVQLQLATAPSPPSWSAIATASFRTRDEAGTSVIIEVQINADLSAALLERVAVQAKPDAPAPALASSEAEEEASYQRLMDVGLEVKLRFGSRRMALRDILALSAGIVVELDSSVSAPVDLLLDGRTIARGEVVVVDGKYGLRVTNVVDSRPPGRHYGEPS